ncbi:MAG: exo-alpha-sialidase [Lentisphaeria bacterium]|nr:exo-alpha-sialidase [Lentisphaeria bacterium]
MCQTPVLSSPRGKYAPGARKHQGIPGIEITPEGRLFVCYYCGPEPCEGPGNYLVTAVSADGGNTWHEQTVIAPAEPDQRVFDPVLWLAPDGILRVFFAMSRSPKAGDVFDGRAGVWVSECADHRADELRWSEPRRIGDGIMMNKPTVLHDGSWALPAALWSFMPAKQLPELDGWYRPNLLLTSDGGNSFRLLRGPEVPDRHCDEHVIVERRDHSLWMLVRTRYGIGQSFSYDGGRSWTPGEDSRLGGPNSRFALRRLKSGRLCLINHISEPRRSDPAVIFPKREKLAVWLSDDDGASWYGRLMLDPGPNVSYPDFTEGRDGWIYAVYDRGRIEHGQIFLARFTEKDIAAGAFTVPGSTGGILAASFESAEA